MPSGVTVAKSLQWCNAEWRHCCQVVTVVQCRVASLLPSRYSSAMPSGVTVAKSLQWCIAEWRHCCQVVTVVQCRVASLLPSRYSDAMPSGVTVAECGTMQTKPRGGSTQRSGSSMELN